MDPQLTGLRRVPGGVAFTWSDGLSVELTPRQLRLRCPCAACVSETTGRRLLDASAVPAALELVQMQPVGRYAYRMLYGDGHDTGIYTLEHLRELCQHPPSE